jgi:hypothetical protein
MQMVQGITDRARQRNQIATLLATSIARSRLLLFILNASR